MAPNEPIRIEKKISLLLLNYLDFLVDLKLLVGNIPHKLNISEAS